MSLAMEMERAPSMPFVRSSTLRRFRRGAPLGSSFVALAIDIEFDDESESEPIVEFEATAFSALTTILCSTFSRHEYLRALYSDGVAPDHS